MFQNEVALLKRVEARIEKDRNQSHGHSGSWGRSSWGATMSNGERPVVLPAAQSVSFATPPPSAFFGHESNKDNAYQALL